MLACTSGSFKASAQTDLQLVHYVSDTIECGNQTPAYIFAYLFINNGANALTQNDTIVLATPYATLNLLLPQTGLPVGDTVGFLDTVAFGPQFSPTQQVQWCDSIWAKSGTIIVDPVIANNEDCDQVQIINDPASVKNFATKINEGSLAVYPNPATNSISFNYYGNSIQETMITVIDITGRKVIRKSLGKMNGAQKADVDVSSLSNGIYVIELNSGYQKQTSKFVIQK
jgi:hypothetical protein